MTRRRDRATMPPSAWPDRLEQAALMVVLCVVCARGLIQERPDYEQLNIVNRLHGGSVDSGGPGPATSLVLDGLVLVAFSCCAVAAAVRGRWLRRPGGVELALAMMVLAAAISLIAAGNLRLAINTSINRITPVLILLILSWTVRRWWQVRVVMAGIAASGVTFAAFCFTQVLERQDTRQWITERKEEAVRTGRIDADDPMIQLLENRANADESTGFFAHSNISGSYLAAVALATVGLGIARLRSRRKTFRVLFGVVTLTAAAAMVAALVLTRSRGALASGLLCAVTWLAVGVVWWRWESLRRWAAGRWRMLLVGGWSAVVLVVVATVVVALHRGGLPGHSLMFRWHYWTGASHIIAQHPWTGVGAGNFDRHYVRYKPAEVPEEVKNPHNFLVTMATEWGVLGLASGVMLIVAVSAALCRPAGDRSPTSDEPGDSPAGDGGRIVLWLIPLTIAVLVARSVASPGQLWLIWALAPALTWAIAFVSTGLDSDQPARFESDPLIVSGGLIAALLTVLLHNTISFSMIHPGSACTFFAMAGLAMAAGRMGNTSNTARESDAPGSARLRWLAVGSALVTVAYWPIFVSPVVKTANLLSQARRGATTDEVTKFYRMAIAADSFDSIAPSEMARWCIRQAQSATSQTRQIADLAVAGARQAIERDHQDNRHHRTLASAYLIRYVAGGDPNDVDRAEQAGSNAVAGYPRLPALRIDYGEILVLQAKTRRQPGLLKRGLDQMRLALELDDRRWQGEIRRFSAERRSKILDRIRDLEAQATTTSRATTSPGSRK